MAKTLLTRTQRRARLRTQLRDSGSTIWSDTALNECLDEALLWVQSRYPGKARTVIPVTTQPSGRLTRTYALPADCIGVREVRVVRASTDAAFLDDPEDPASAVTLTGLTVGYAASVDAWSRILRLAEDPPRGGSIVVYYLQSLAPWGDPADTTLDTVTKDLQPGDAGDGLAGLLFYACGRVAAYRYAMQIVDSAGSRDFADDLKIATAEREELLSLSAPTRAVLRAGNGLFAGVA